MIKYVSKTYYIRTVTRSKRNGNLLGVQKLIASTNKFWNMLFFISAVGIKHNPILYCIYKLYQLPSETELCS